MGVVSSIGANVAEVTRALKEAKSGVTFAPPFAELGFRCQVYARPTVDPEAALDRRTRRFMGEGAAWN
ncbi:MAG TPA: beta-ketoacyl-ACP synthase I, partial [Parvularcula sp.]|nr:beta-ketoacyl-ACP synthase I [Parvularcula sp.]